jgi:two-component system LytT family sensor kinase
MPPLRTTPVLPMRIVLGTIALFWAAYFLINTAKAAILHLDGQLDMLWRRALVVVAGVGATFVFHQLMVPLRQASMRARIAAVALLSVPFAALYASINYLCFYRLLPSPMLEEDLAAMAQKGVGAGTIILEGTVSWYFFFATWGTVMLALALAEQAREAERRAAHYVGAAREAQLLALRYQVNPHFLFNTLNSLSTLILRDRRDDAERMVEKLAAFFRTSLTADPIDDVTLAEEMRLQRLYLEIEEVRFPDRMLIRIDVPPELERACVPTLILQPLVENAVKHGVARSKELVTIRIRASAHGGTLTVAVEDNARPCAGESKSASARVGLGNVRGRLRARFGDTGDCRWGKLDPCGFRAAIHLPLVVHGQRTAAPSHAYS